MIIRLTDLFFVNAQAKDLQVEIMDENGNVITGFSREDCKEMNDLNSTKQLVTWKSGKKLAALSGKIVKVKFYVRGEKRCVSKFGRSENI